MKGETNMEQTKKLRLSGVVTDSIVDGKGIRMTVFVQGCPHHCPGCHNPQTHDFSAGYEDSVDRLVEKLKEDPLQCGVTLSGGEPFCQAVALFELAKKVKALGKNVWAYSGYTFEELTSGKIPFAKELLSVCDVLVDGRFLIEQRNLTLPFRGSENQRVLDVAASLAQNKPVLLAL